METQTMKRPRIKKVAQSAVLAQRAWLSKKTDKQRYVAGRYVYEDIVIVNKNKLKTLKDVGAIIHADIKTIIL